MDGERCMEYWDALKPGGYRFVYDDCLFPPGTDTFLLSSLPRLKPGLRICDLGCGTGLLGLLLLQRQADLTVTGVDIQAEAIRLAERAAAENRLEDRLTFRQLDLRKVREYLPAGSFDLVVCNPPYFPAGAGAVAEGPRGAARSDITCTLDDMCKAAARNLKEGGKLIFCIPPKRLQASFKALADNGFEAKAMKLVRRDFDTLPRLALIEARFHGGEGMELLPDHLERPKA